MNPFRLTKSLGSESSNLYRRRSTGSPVSTLALGPKSTASFKARYDRSLEKTRRSLPKPILKEAILSLGKPEEASTSLEAATRLGNAKPKNRAFSHISVAKDFKTLRIRQESKVKDDSVVNDFGSSSFQRVRSNTMPSLKKCPGPGGGTFGKVNKLIESRMNVYLLTVFCL